MNQVSSVKVAVAQMTPVMFDKSASVEKACRAIREAGKNGAKIILFPEAFIGGYPGGLHLASFLGPRRPEGRKDFRRYYEGSAIYLPGPETDALGRAAAEAGAYVVMGVTEKEENNSTLYCTAVFIGPDGSFLGKHRKLMPSGMERHIWGRGDGSTLPVFDTPYGKIGAVICREHQMPLLRAAMYAKGVRILLVPTLDDTPQWQNGLRFIGHEGRCFIMACCQYLPKSAYPQDIACLKELDEQPDVIVRGGSAISGPMGTYVAEPVYDKEWISYATLDLGEIEEARFDFDVAAHYNRPDVFQLHVNERKIEGFFFESGKNACEEFTAAEDVSAGDREL